MDINVNEDSHGALEDVMYIGETVPVKQDNMSVKSYHVNVREKFGEGQCEGDIGHDQIFIKVQYDLPRFSRKL